MKKRLALISHEYYPVLCGGTIFAEKIAQELGKLGYEVVILTPGIGKGFPKVEKNASFEVRRFYTGRTSVGDSTLMEHLRFILFGLPQLFWHCFRNSYDLLFPVFVIPTGFLALIISKILRVPSVVFVDAADTPGVDSAMKNIIGFLKILFSFTTKHSSGVAILDGLQDLAGPLINNNVTAVIPNGATIPSLRASPGTSGGKIRFLSIGRLVLRKGFGDILKAFSKVKERGLDFELSIVGYGGQDKVLEQLLRDYDISDNVRLVGRVEYDQLKDFYLNADCYIFYGKREGSSLAMIEAIAYGLPVIATKHPGNSTFVESGANGFLVDENDIDALSAAFCRTIEKGSELRDWGTRSREIAATYSWTEIAKKYDELFKRAMDN
jgi:glycosyltransferase involved in cell wall biosynthesis